MSGRVLCRSARMRLYHEFESGMVVISRKSTRGHCRNREDKNRTYCLEVGCRFASFQIKKSLGSWLQRSPRTPTHQLPPSHPLSARPLLQSDGRYTSYPSFPSLDDPPGQHPQAQ
jgi:hypothetical protein